MRVHERDDNVAIELPNLQPLIEHPPAQRAEKPQLMRERPQRVATLKQPHAVPSHERLQPSRPQTRLRHRHRLLVGAAPRRSKWPVGTRNYADTRPTLTLTNAATPGRSPTQMNLLGIVAVSA